MAKMVKTEPIKIIFTGVSDKEDAELRVQFLSIGCIASTNETFIIGPPLFVVNCPF